MNGWSVERPNWTALEGVFAEVREAWRGVGDAQRRMLEVTGVAWSDDRMVKAVVGPRGQLVELDIDPRIYRTPNSKALSATIVTTVRRAVDDAMQQSKAIIDGHLPRDQRLTRVGNLAVDRLMSSHDADLREEREADDD
jgi:hypothetical protein